ncbi:MAG: hypothetical protein JKX99_02760 [Robiginitomaculum sp.]|nr:hypothetical protein [Robiginitomaculum sp.]
MLAQTGAIWRKIDAGLAVCFVSRREESASDGAANGRRRAVALSRASWVSSLKG